jgi:hypothetical protein
MIHALFFNDRPPAHAMLQPLITPPTIPAESTSHIRLMPVPVSARFADRNYHIWCGSMVRDSAGLCHLFYSRWPRAAGFNAWATHSEIARATATQPLGPYVHQEVVLAARDARHWDGMTTHNPTVITIDGRYFLYYTGSTGDRKPAPTADTWNWLHRNSQRIGVAVAAQPCGPWLRRDLPLVDVAVNPHASDSLVVGNPSVTQRPDGGFLMIYKAVGKANPLPFGGPVVHRVALADRPEGPFVKQPNPVFTAVGSRFPAEDPFVWQENGRYRAILKDMHGAFTAAGRSLVLFESEDGIHWQLSEPCLLSDRTVQFEDGTRQQFDYLERPQLYFEDGKPAVLFCAARLGDETCNLHIPLQVKP